MLGIKTVQSNYHRNAIKASIRYYYHLTGKDLKKRQYSVPTKVKGDKLSLPIFWKATWRMKTLVHRHVPINVLCAYMHIYLTQTCIHVVYIS